MSASRIPPYHKHPPTGPLPATLDAKLFPDPLTQNVYALAAKEKKILYQEPCYCGCDREVVHHKSLLDCYIDRHASFCATCRMEAVFAYQEYRKGKTAAQIRREIILRALELVSGPFCGTPRLFRDYFTAAGRCRVMCVVRWARMTTSRDQSVKMP
jgi:hypothetical protein